MQPKPYWTQAHFHVESTHLAQLRILQKLVWQSQRPAQPGIQLEDSLLYKATACPAHPQLASVQQDQQCHAEAAYAMMCRYQHLYSECDTSPGSLQPHCQPSHDPTQQPHPTVLPCCCSRATTGCPCPYHCQCTWPSAAYACPCPIRPASRTCSTPASTC